MVLSAALVLAQNGITINNSANGGVTIAGSPSGVTFLAGGSNNGNGIPATLFGLTDSWKTITPLISYGMARSWDSMNAKWRNMENCIPGAGCTAASNNWNFTDLDTALVDIKANCPGGVTCSMIYQFGDIADYANNCGGSSNNSGCPSGDPTGTGCGNNPNGACYLPPDVSTAGTRDGGGTDLSIITFWQFLATHLSTLDATHAKVSGFSLYNEFNRDPCIGSEYNATTCAKGNPNGNYIVSASLAELQRMYGDMKDTVTGILGSSGITFYLGSPYNDATVWQPMMYCTNLGKAAGTACGCPSGKNTSCTGSGNGLTGHVGGLDFHRYSRDYTGQGEEIIGDATAILGYMTGSDKNLPLIVSETSFGNLNELPDWGMQAGFALREMVACWSAGISTCYWYRYNSLGCYNQTHGSYFTGSMYDYTKDSHGNPLTNYQDCVNGGTAPGLWWDGNAYQQAYNWLVGYSLTQTAACSGTQVGASNTHIWSCYYQHGALNYEIVWVAFDKAHANYKSWCANWTPITKGSCVSQSYTYPSTLGFGHYETTTSAADGTGVQVLSGGVVNISGQPILLEP